MPSATISGSKTSDIGNPHDGKSIHSGACTPWQQESPAPHACDTYATTVQNTPVQVHDRHCGHECREPTTNESGELGQWGCVGNLLGKRRDYWVSSALPLRSCGAARPKRRLESISCAAGSAYSRPGLTRLQQSSGARASKPRLWGIWPGKRRFRTSSNGTPPATAVRWSWSVTRKAQIT